MSKSTQHLQALPGHFRLNAMGITAFVLRYRVVPDKIGILGFSAGGHLASTAETRFDAGNAKAMDPIDRVSSRPDFAVLCYSVISFATEYAHRWSRENLLGKDANLELRQSLSNETQVTKETPPTFLWSTSTDTAVPPENSVAFYLALHKAGVPAELHIFADAPHGVGLYLQDQSVGEWGTLLRNWLRERGFEIRLIPNLSPTKSAWVLRQAFVDLNAYTLLCGKLFGQLELVGASGFEPPTCWSRTTRTKI